MPPEHAPLQQVVDQSSTANPSPLSPRFAAGHVPSPPPASSVRRHQSLTHGAQRQLPSSGLKRAGTLQQTGSRHTAAVGQTPSPPDPEEEEYNEEDLVNPYEDESYFNTRSPPPNQQQYGNQGTAQYPTSPIGRSSPWGTPGGADWRTPGGMLLGSAVSSVDDVARALSAMELNNSNQLYSNSAAFQGSQSAHPPRFNPNQPSPHSPGSMRQNATQGGNGTSRKLQLNTDTEGRRTPTGQSVRVSIQKQPPSVMTITARIYERRHCNRCRYVGSTRETSLRIHLQFKHELWL